jgi:hypothetical protein
MHILLSSWDFNLFLDVADVGGPPVEFELPATECRPEARLYKYVGDLDGVFIYIEPAPRFEVGFGGGSP